MNTKFNEIAVLKESEHQLYGLGTIKYEYSCKSKTLKIFVDYYINKKYNEPSIILTGKTAFDVWSKFIGLSDEYIPLNVDNLLSLIHDISGFKYDELKERNREGVRPFSRFLVMYGAMKYLNYSDKDAAGIFDLDRVTALHAVNVVSKENKYFKPIESQMKIRFERAIKKILMSN